MIYIPSWLESAIFEMRKGITEIPGEGHNPRILEYGTAVDLTVTTDEIPWCSNFVNWVFMDLEMERTRSARARSWLRWGDRLTVPALGCVVILQRGTGEQPGPEVIDAPGHVGLLTGMDEPGTVTLIGGNQSNKVCERTYPFSRVLAMRYPA